MSHRRLINMLWRVVVRLVPVIVGTVGLVFVVAWMSGAFRDKVTPGERSFAGRTAKGLDTATVTQIETPEIIDAVGTIQPRAKTDVASRLLATINDVYVAPGDQVRAGQLLAELDDREIQAQLREAEAAASGIEADLAVRQREYDRYKKMFAENAVTKETFDQIEGAYEMAKAQLRRTQAQLNRIHVMLTYAQIKAQTSGVVADRYLDPGDLAVPGKPIVSIHDPDQLELHANVPESLAGRVELGMAIPVRIDAVSLNVTGTVREIVPHAEATSRSVLVKVQLPADKLHRVYIGMFGRIGISVGSIERLVADKAAVQRVGQLELVDVVREDGTLERRFVRTGIELGDKVEILSGLHPGETIVRPSTS